MKKIFYAILAATLAGLLLAPVFADVIVPPGPPSNQSEWISPTLWAFNAKTLSPIGWTYTDGPTYNVTNGVTTPQTLESSPANPTLATPNTVNTALNVPWGTQVLVLGFIPGVTVAVDQVPPPVELKLTWDGIPNTITLSVPASNVVGVNYPPTFYPDINTVYQFGYPATAPSKNATYNLWVGDYSYILQHIFGTTLPPVWWETAFGKTYGEWFWYKYTPNTGDYISLDSMGQTKFPPTYDITAMFEYGTSQVWFNHVCFDVSFLRLHKDVSYCDGQTINDQITISNVGLLPATGLDITQTFPSEYKFSIVPNFNTAMAQITQATPGSAVNTVVQSWTPLANFWSVAYPNDYTFAAPFNTLAPGQNLTITMTLNIYDTGSGFVGTVVFDSELSCAQVQPFQYPLGLAALVYPEGASPSGTTVPLWSGYYLSGSGPTLSFGLNPEWYVTGPLLRTAINHPAPVFTIDPAPVPLIAGETTVTAADVALVRNAVLGLAPYDQRMDTNGNGKVDVQDLKAYEAAVGS